jgi:2-oxoglutarate dehydrogenase complex dehydrogenase (E1) component-like enzyme
MVRDDFGPNEWLIDELYRRYVEDPSSVGDAWQEFFEDYRPSEREPAEAPGEQATASPIPRTGERLRPDFLPLIEKQGRVLQLINQYRVRGHLIADLDPLGLEEHEMRPDLDPASYGLAEKDMEGEFVTGGLAGRAVLTLAEILRILRAAYCGTHAPEYMHIQEPE